MEEDYAAVKGYIEGVGISDVEVHENDAIRVIINISLNLTHFEKVFKFRTRRLSPCYSKTSCHAFRRREDILRFSWALLVIIVFKFQDFLA